ncbi:acylphosphatase [Frondihabitans sp. PhB188]|uniref:acylphosphatase n=1 Tax=Frondihabitans sp. PhB188 TaxID=2485200 RepID=UPI000F4717D4|nr:acylphosphatase [Frondihabitans sp. PhB188]ROQ39459.1 acylphosphatase [Frondihabitans sp. PhB188]
MTDLIRRRLLVDGVVQGVGFRYWTEHEANRIGVAGFVRNREDGRVEIEAEGTPDRVAELLAWVRDGGPAAARVDGVEVGDVPVRGEGGFTTAR